MNIIIGIFVLSLVSNADWTDAPPDKEIIEMSSKRKTKVEMFNDEWNDKYALHPVYKEMFHPEFKKKFIFKVCGLKKKYSKLQLEKCNNKFMNSFFAKLGEVYPLSDFKKIDNWCTANPIECHDLKEWEMEAKFQKSHDDTKYEIAAVKREQQERNQAELERRKQLVEEYNEIQRRNMILQHFQHQNLINAIRGN